MDSVASRPRGVTLIELLVVVAILAVLLGLAVPNLREFFVVNRLGSTSNELVAALAATRNEAIRRGTAVTMCRTNAANANGCSTDASRNWGVGWTVCVDDIDTTVNPPAPRGRCKSPVATNTIRTGNVVSLPLTVYSSTTFSGAVTFDAGGRVVNTAANAGTTYPGAFVVCHQLSNNSWGFSESGRPRSRLITLNAAGRIRLAVDTDGNGVPNGDAGSDMTGTCTQPAG